MTPMRSWSLIDEPFRGRPRRGQEPSELDSTSSPLAPTSPLGRRLPPRNSASPSIPTSTLGVQDLLGTHTYHSDPVGPPVPWTFVGSGAPDRAVGEASLGPFE